MSTTEQSTELPDVQPMPTVVQFASRGRHLTIERVRPRRVVSGAGEVFWTEPVHYEFQDGVLLIHPGQDTIADKFDPATGQVAEQDAIEFLRSHELYATDRGFWEVAPLTPDPAPLMQTIMQLAVAAGNPATRDEAEQRLVDIHEAEATSWQRPVVLQAVEVALSALESHASLTAAEDAERPEPWQGVHGATREMPGGPPIAQRGADGVLVVDPSVMGSQGFGEHEQNLSLGGSFNPEAAPPKEQ